MPSKKPSGTAAALAACLPPIPETPSPALQDLVTPSNSIYVPEPQPNTPQPINNPFIEQSTCQGTSLLDHLRRFSYWSYLFFIVATSLSTPSYSIWWCTYILWWLMDFFDVPCDSWLFSTYIIIFLLFSVTIVMVVSQYVYKGSRWWP